MASSGNSYSAAFKPFSVQRAKSPTVLQRVPTLHCFFFLIQILKIHLISHWHDCKQHCINGAVSSVDVIIPNDQTLIIPRRTITCRQTSGKTSEAVLTGITATKDPPTIQHLQQTVSQENALILHFIYLLIDWTSLAVVLNLNLQ